MIGKDDVNSEGNRNREVIEGDGTRASIMDAGEYNQVVGTHQAGTGTKLNQNEQNNVNVLSDRSGYCRSNP